MNERIKNLGIQAGLMTGEKEQLFFCRPIAQFDEYSPELEKFAELIVQECINCYSPDDSATDWADKMRRMIEP